jgi:hypothetical protein
MDWECLKEREQSWSKHVFWDSLKRINRCQEFDYAIAKRVFTPFLHTPQSHSMLRNRINLAIDYVLIKKVLLIVYTDIYTCFLLKNKSRIIILAHKNNTILLFLSSESFLNTLILIQTNKHFATFLYWEHMS